MSEPAGFIDEPPPRRRSEAYAPIEVWRRALLSVLLLATLAGAWFIWGRTPMPVADDTRQYADQFRKLDAQAAALRRAGQRPLTIVFLGTSRMRNVAFDSAGVAASAKQAGILRPVASTVIGINWGGFERLVPAFAMTEARKPDVVVVMPELLAEDLTRGTRLRFGKGWIESKMWGTDFTAFGADEGSRLVCHGFAQTPEQRNAQASSFVSVNFDGPGPKLGRGFLGRLAANGTRVIFADVPIAERLLATRPQDMQGAKLAERLNIDEIAGATPLLGRARIPSRAYCDQAHIDPSHGQLWREPFFAEAAPLLNGLP